LVKFFPEDAPAPQRLETDRFIIRWLTPADAEMDYEAIREAMPYYMKINPADWRDQTFSLEDNREEMHRHERENHDKEAFTFIVTTLDGARSYGCVYVCDLLSLMRSGGAPQAELDAIGDHECQVHLFITPSGIDQGIDEQVVRAMMKWLDDDWPFSRWVFQADAADARLCEMLEGVGLNKTHALKEGRWAVYARDA
jgi:RimJ/RimL family protein N-acetyltransferase